MTSTRMALRDLPYGRWVIDVIVAPVGGNSGIGVELLFTADGSKTWVGVEKPFVTIASMMMEMTDDSVDIVFHSECAHRCECHSYGCHDF